MSKSDLDMSRLQSAYRELEKHSKFSCEQLVRRSAKGFVTDIIAVTPPGSRGVSGTQAKKQGERAIAADISRIFTPLSQGGISAFIALHQGIQSTTTYGHAGAKPLGTIKSRVLTRGEMKAWHQARRRPSDGRVMNVKRDVTTGHRIRDLAGLDTGIVSFADLNWYITQSQKLVGLLASGWVASARKLGVSAPAWIKRHGDSRGSFTPQISATRYRLTLSNGVPFVTNVRQYWQRIQRVINYQAAKMERQADFLLNKSLKKAGFK